MPFRTKLVWVSRAPEPGTLYMFLFLGTRDHTRVFVLCNAVSVPLFKKKNQFLAFHNFSREEFENIHLFIKMILVNRCLNFLILCKVKKQMILISIFENTRGLNIFLISIFQDSIANIFRCAIIIEKLFEIFFQNYPAFEIHLYDVVKGRMT